MCRTIVLIDDSAFDNLYHSLILQRTEGFERVLAFEDPEQGLAFVAGAPDVDLVLLDINMPSMSGWEFLDALAAQGGTLPRVVILTSSSDPCDVTRADAHPGACGFRTKPLTEKMAEELVAECIAART